MSSKKNKHTAKWLLAVSILALIPVSLFVWSTFRREKLADKARFVNYPAFGIDIPVNYMIHGIDVSSYQETIYWPAVKAMNVNGIRLGFTFIKATEGLSSIDKFFASNWQKAKQDSIVRGAYLFFLATKDGKEQAQNFINTVKLEKGDLPPVIDIEQLYGVSPSLMRVRVLECLQTLEAYYKVRPLLYSYADFYQNYLGKDFNDYPLWVAHYLEKEKPRINRDWTFWQHNDAGKVNGIVTDVDFNAFKGDSIAFQKLLVQ
jgi:lysozyme